jgi:mRNA-degrading endonuclease HigB of HigAB toxin-antitoxin module
MNPKISINQILNKGIIILSFFLIAFATPSCKKKKELAAKAAQEAALKTELTQSLNNLLANNELHWSEMQKQLDQIKNKITFEDAELSELVSKVQQKIDELKTQEAEAKRNEEERAAVLKAKEKSLKFRFSALDDRFKGIAEASSAEAADKMIAETLNLFDNPKTPLLIIVFEQGDQKDYDKPTNIKDYLNYIKDRKIYNNNVVNIEYNDNQKINLIELKKIN